MAIRKRRDDGELWGAEGADQLWTGDDYEVAVLSKQTGRPAIDVRRAIMKVGQNRTGDRGAERFAPLKGGVTDGSAPSRSWSRAAPEACNGGAFSSTAGGK
jgi:hypothetical protein